MMDTLTIAVDFDGTIVEDNYPSIGKPHLFAFDTLKKLQEKGHRLILWTYRYGKELEEAVIFCEENGVVFYAVNKSFPEEEFDPKYSRKINADIFIDDRNIQGHMGWGEVYQKLIGEAANLPKPKKRKNWLGF
ncbi:MAG TPA: hydrolase [Flavobacteriaceae bacterium]|nr:hydrolase [Flavobacteriaceae bacterium]HPF12062.1 hydrolase [Flavobacteriaceae bacterium]HQU21507.1 hydrolase [Flavobacteriaceae bacterium]HQU65657.1 hydrolase [Flavobacteriaceae bacterium]HRW44838.1 hydrolase [Flavobacteriaceae bacterium]